MDGAAKDGASVPSREILRLAVPAFFALVAEPLFLLADAAVVGRLGAVPLAGLGIAAAVLQAAVGLCVFLAYGSTAAVARRLGSGDRRGALALGIDGLSLAVGIGVALTVVGVLTTGPLVRAFGAGAEVSEAAVTYLRIAWLGTAPLLLMLAATGVLRGLQDTRTPLVVAVAGNGLNVVLNVVLVHGLGRFDGLGVAGAAIGSVVAQAASAAWLVAVVLRGARAQGASARPHRSGIREAGRAGVPLLLRTVSLRAALLLTTYAATLAATGQSGGEAEGGPAGIAAHQLALTLWGFLAFVLDALAIAAQALTGRTLGAGDVRATRAMTRRMVRWGCASGVVTGLLLAAAAPWLGPLFTADPEVHRLLVPLLLVAAAGQPWAGVVFVLDGVLIGAGDGRYLALGSLATLLVHAPLVLLVAALGGGLVGVWVAMVGGFMGTRGIVLLARARTDRWLVTGGHLGGGRGGAPTLGP